MSLAGVESTTVSPAQTSHALLVKKNDCSRYYRGLDSLFGRNRRFEDLIADIEQAIEKTIK